MNLAELREEVQAILGREYEVKEVEVTKTNDMVLKGLSIGKVEDVVRPTIYVNGSMTPEEVVKTYNMHMESGHDISADVCANEIFTKEYILKNVFPVLLNSGRNKELLKTAVHRPYADLNIAYRVSVDNIKDCSATFLVLNQHIQRLGIDEDCLHENAIRNIKGIGCIKGIAEVLRNAGFPTGDDMDDCPMKVITGINGAGAILDTEIIDEIKNTIGDCYIIPSSINELLAVPRTDDCSLDILVSIIKEMNRTEVSECDFLSDNAYIITDGRLEVVE